MKGGMHKDERGGVVQVAVGAGQGVGVWWLVRWGT